MLKKITALCCSLVILESFGTNNPVLPKQMILEVQRVASPDLLPLSQFPQFPSLPTSSPTYANPLYEITEIEDDDDFFGFGNDGTETFNPASQRKVTSQQGDYSNRYPYIDPEFARICAEQTKQRPQLVLVSTSPLSTTPVNPPFQNALPKTKKANKCRIHVSIHRKPATK